MRLNNNIPLNTFNNNVANNLVNVSAPTNRAKVHPLTKAAIPSCPVKTRLTLSALLTSGGLLLGALGLPSMAQAESHGTGAIATQADNNAPLPELSSLKDNSELTLTLPNIQHFTTKAGVPVAFVRSSALPIVDIDLRFNAGSARDTDIRPEGFGIAGMTATMLTQGTETLSEEAFTRAVETLGINLTTHAYKDMFIVSLRSLSDQQHLDPALDLVEQMLAKPRFDKATLARNKARLMVGLQQQQQDPSSLASLAFTKALFGDHPYAHPSTGTLETVPNLTAKDLANFRERYLVAANATLAITGDLTLAQAKALADSLTQVLPKGQPAPKLPDAKPLSKGKRIHIPFDSSQTTVIMGQLGDKRSSDAAELQRQANFAVGNEVLAGGDFNARLMTEIRKNLGYTYGISGGMSPMQARGPYQISFSTRNDKAQAAIEATLDTIQSTLDKGLSKEEVRLTKDSQKNSFPMSFASNTRINGLLGMMNFYHLPDSYFTQQLSRIDGVSLNGANEALRQKITPSKFLIVTVGDEVTPGDGNATTSDSLSSKP